jgi:NAD(P)-dependent dehydrogenase (short-subunit alcohol dehydrogenase family)
MKIAITGGSSSVGQSIVKAYNKRGHTVIDISRSLGYNFNNVNSIVDAILPCDVFVNCLHLADLQVVLLEQVWNRWADTNKEIINVSTCITLPAFEAKDAEYKKQKILLEAKHWELISKNALSPKMYLVKFGDGNDNTTWDTCCDYIVNSIELAKPDVLLFEMSVFK